MAISPTSSCMTKLFCCLGPKESTGHLGLQFTWKGHLLPKYTDRLGHILQEILKVLLNPYQWLQLLRIYSLLQFSMNLY